MRLEVAKRAQREARRLAQRIQRVLMPGTKNHVYYHRKSDTVVRGVSLWGAVRGRGPKL